MIFKPTQLMNHIIITKCSGEVATDREISKRNKFDCMEKATKWCDELNEYNAKLEAERATARLKEIWNE